MKVLLILPNPPKIIYGFYKPSALSALIYRITGLGSSDITPPLGLLMIAAVTPPDIEIKLIDERIEDINFDEPVDLVGISVITRNALRAYDIADQFRLHGVKVVMGGVHPSALPKEALQHADSVVLGEGEGIWPTVLQDAQNGCLKPTYRGRVQMDLDALPFPRRDLIRYPEKYVTIKSLTATRGCLNTCTFCSAGVGLVKRFRKRSVAKVIEELEKVPGKLATFMDDNIGWDVEYAKELFRAVIPLRLHWTGELSMNALEDPELIDLAAQSGCMIMLVGLESISPKVIASIRKDKTNKPHRYAAAIRRMQQAGIAVWGNFIIGFDDEEEDTIPRLLDFIHQTNLEMVNINILIPYPGSFLYKKYEREGRLLHKDWRFYEDFGGYCVYTPMRTTPLQLMDKYQQLLNRLYTPQTFLVRLAHSPARFSLGSLSSIQVSFQNRSIIPAQKRCMQEYVEYLEINQLI